jgi:hypothetical protein
VPEPIRAPIHEYPDLSETVEYIKMEKLVQGRLEQALGRLRNNVRLKEFHLFIDMVCMDYSLALVEYDTGHLDEAFGLTASVQKISDVVVGSAVPVEFKVYHQPEQVDEKPLLLGTLCLRYDEEANGVSDHIHHFETRPTEAGRRLHSYVDVVLELFEE